MTLLPSARRAEGRAGITRPPRDHWYVRPRTGILMQGRTRSRLWLWLGVILLALLVACGVGAYLIWAAAVKVGDALSTDTRVGVRAVTTNGQLELHLTYGKEATGLATVTFLDPEGNRLWEINGQGQSKPGRIVYGQLPADPTMPWRQEFPENGPPPADIRGKTVNIRVTNRFQ